MRVLFVLAFFLFVTSCSLFEGSTTVEIINDNEYYSSSVPYFNGTLYEVEILLYIGEDLAGQESTGIIPTDGGTSGIIEIESTTEKVRASFKFMPDDFEYSDQLGNKRIYTTAYTYIEKGEHNVIEINENTIVQNYMKSKMKRVSAILHAQNHNP